MNIVVTALLQLEKFSSLAFNFMNMTNINDAPVLVVGAEIEARGRVALIDQPALTTEGVGILAPGSNRADQPGRL